MYSSTLHIMKVLGRDVHAHHIPFIVAVMVLLIVVTGGWVRISDAGESCPDWPTCFGEFGFNISSEKQMEWWSENPDEADSRHENDPDFTYTTKGKLPKIINITHIHSIEFELNFAND